MAHCRERHRSHRGRVRAHRPALEGQSARGARPREPRLVRYRASWLRVHLSRCGREPGRLRAQAPLARPRLSCPALNIVHRHSHAANGRTRGGQCPLPGPPEGRRRHDHRGCGDIADRQRRHDHPSAGRIRAAHRFGDQSFHDRSKHRSTDRPGSDRGRHRHPLFRTSDACHFEPGDLAAPAVFLAAPFGRFVPTIAPGSRRARQLVADLWLPRGLHRLASRPRRPSGDTGRSNRLSRRERRWVRRPDSRWPRRCRGGALRRFDSHRRPGARGDPRGAALPHRHVLAPDPSRLDRVSHLDP